MTIRNNREESVLEDNKHKLKLPPLYKVLILNDDFTPMDFVVMVLQTFFFMTQEKAIQVMLKVHNEGAGICGIYPSDIAMTKVKQVNDFSKQNQHPLKCVMEENT